jgi:hypothetical protein
MPKKAAGRKSGLKSGSTESEALPPGGSAALVFCRSFYRPFLRLFTVLFYDFYKSFL